MSKQTMISVRYNRIPKETVYSMKMTVDRVEQTMEDPQVEGLSRISSSSATMEEIIAAIHTMLQEHPDAKVTMIRKIPKKLMEGNEGREEKGFELDQKMVDLIRTDLPAAQKQFAPIEQTVNIRPFVPTLEVKEK
jgi:replicative DNA helicase